jgi:hypothetical protein
LVESVRLTVGQLDEGTVAVVAAVAMMVVGGRR